MLPPSLNELESRLKNRGTESESKVRERMEVSKAEIQQLFFYDYILTNFNAEETTENLTLIIKAEHFKKERYCPSSPDIASLINKEND